AILEHALATFGRADVLVERVSCHDPPSKIDHRRRSTDRHDGDAHAFEAVGDPFDNDLERHFRLLTAGRTPEPARAWPAALRIRRTPARQRSRRRSHWLRLLERPCPRGAS